MKINTTPISGNEAFWGEVKPTSDQIALINKSPTLVGQIHDTNDGIATGEFKPMTVDPNMGASGIYYPDKKQIQLAQPGSASDPSEFTGVLSHEMGHLTSHDSDKAFEKAYVSDANPRDPNLFNNSSMYANKAEAEAQLNNYKVGKEIEQNTATPDQPGTRISDYLTNAETAAIGDADANRPAGLTDTQNDARLLHAGMQQSATAGGHGSEGSYNFYGQQFTKGGAATEPGSPVSVSYQSGDKPGDIDAASQTWQSGDVSTQNFKDGKVQSTQTVDPSGKVLQSAAYNYNPDGGYGMTVKNGDGRTIQQSNFNADKSGNETGFNADGSRKTTDFDSQNQTTRMTQYNPQGGETQKDYFDTKEGLDTNQVRTNPDGSRTVYSFNDQGKAGLETNYDANGKQTGSSFYDPDTGRMTTNSHVNPDGSRSVDTIGADGTGSRVDVDKDGNRSAAQNVNYSPEQRQAFDKDSDDARQVAPPQPVGADNALGGQQNYYDPSNNRRTNQVISHDDGSKTLNSYTDKNLVGLTNEYGPDGKQTSSSYYKPDGSGEVDTRVTNDPDGSRTVQKTGAKDISINSYNAQNQLTQRQTMSPTDGIKTEQYDPETGKVTSTDHTALGGERSVTSYGNQGLVGREDSNNANSQPTSSVNYNPNERNGTLTYATFNPDGSRQIDSANTEGHLSYTIDKNGDGQNWQMNPLSADDKQKLGEWQAQSQPQAQTQGDAQTQQQALAQTQTQAQGQTQADTQTQQQAPAQQPADNAVASDTANNAAQQAAPASGNDTAQQNQSAQADSSAQQAANDAPASDNGGDANQAQASGNDNG